LSGVPDSGAEVSFADWELVRQGLCLEPLLQAISDFLDDQKDIIDQVRRDLRLELTALNERIEELEKQHPEASKIEALRASAIALAWQIDELRCSSANDLTDLLAK
jgi:uncharacterized protein YydD (DUF2326 family)